jgi:hypothetical protein
MTMVDGRGNIEYTDLPPVGGPPVGGPPVEGPQQDPANTGLPGTIQDLGNTLDRLHRNSVFGAYGQHAAIQDIGAPSASGAVLTIIDENGVSIDVLEEITNLKEENKNLRQRLNQMESAIEELKNWKEV